jgi:hypothetical protein
MDLNLVLNRTLLKIIVKMIEIIGFKNPNNLSQD